MCEEYDSEPCQHSCQSCSAKCPRRDRRDAQRDSEWNQGHASYEERYSGDYQLFSVGVSKEIIQYLLAVSHPYSFRIHVDFKFEYTALLNVEQQQLTKHAVLYLELQIRLKVIYSRLRERPGFDSWFFLCLVAVFSRGV